MTLGLPQRLDFIGPTAPGGRSIEVAVLCSNSSRRSGGSRSDSSSRTEQNAYAECMSAMRVADMLLLNVASCLIACAN